MKPVSLLVAMLLSGGAIPNAVAQDAGNTEHAHQHNMQHSMSDNRISLNLSPEMKQHQLSNMRSHVEAVEAITGLLAAGKFEQASQVAHSKLGLTDEMMKMCSMFENEKFNQLGMAFHKSGDELGNALQSKDMKKSLQALHDTMGYCVQCHATFRQ
jgi:hypothetical protein